MNNNEETENLLHEGASPNRPKPGQENDEKMGMAVMNLSAMLNIDDLDQVIKLLEENNWDESQAANAYMAQQMAGGGGPDTRPGTANEEHKYDDDGVRAPIQQQEDQLIGESPFESLFRQSMQRQAQQNRPRTAHIPASNNGQNDPFIDDNQRRQHAQSEHQALPRMRGPRPRDFTFNIDIPYDAPEDYDNVQPGQPGAVRQQVQQRTWGQYFGSVFVSLWQALKWAFTLGGTITNIGPEQQDFDCGAGILNDDRLLASLELNERDRFFKTAMKSRAHKKPMLLLVVQNPEDQAQIDLIIQNLVENAPHMRDLLMNRFNLFVVSHEQLETKLVNCQQIFRVAPTDDINMFVLFVKSQFKISIMHRIVQHVLTDPDQLMISLNEYANLFDIQAEEDPGYRQIQILQDAGILPVDIHNQNPNPFGGMGASNPPQFGSRPRGVSDSVPQEAIDELLRDDPTQNDDPYFAQQQFGNADSNNLNNIQSVAQSEQIMPRSSVQEEQQMAEQPKPEPPKKQEPERRVINLPEEPQDGDADATRIVFRLPLSGERIQRRFLKSDKLQLLYDFIDHLQNEEKCKFDGVEQYTDQYHILQTRPKVVYTKRDQTLEEAGLWPRGGILQIEQLGDKEESE